LFIKTPVVPLPRQVKLSRTNRAVAVAEKNIGIADGYLLRDRKPPDCDDRESGDKENEVMRLATQHLSAVTLGPWPETSARLLSDLTARKFPRSSREP
jgi:hypothetical protein